MSKSFRMSFANSIEANKFVNEFLSLTGIVLWQYRIIPIASNFGYTVNYWIN